MLFNVIQLGGAVDRNGYNLKLAVAVGTNGPSTPPPSFPNALSIDDDAMCSLFHFYTT